MPAERQDRLPGTIELPAPTAWPIVLGFRSYIGLRGIGHQCLRQHSGSNSDDCWLRRLVSRCAAARRTRIRASGGDSANCRHPPPASRSGQMDDPGTATGATAAGDLSDFRGCQRGLGRKCGHGGSGDALRNYQRPRDLVSDQPFVGWILSGRTATAQIAAFHWDALLIATILHLICSVLVGLLYGAALPMFPRRPILLGGVIAPVLWSGLIHSILEALDPVLNQRIDWLWFVISQIGFGIVAGIVVSRQAARAYVAIPALRCSRRD